MHKLNWRSYLLAGIVLAAIVLVGAARSGLFDHAQTPAEHAAAVAAFNTALAGLVHTAPPPPRTFQTFFTLSGNGSKNSAPFAAPAQWALSYTYDCSGYGNFGNMQIWLYSGSDPAGVPVNEEGASGSSTTYVYTGGPSMHMEIVSECSWTITARG